MRVRLHEPHLADELKADLLAAGCISVAVDGAELAVAHPSAHDDREETLELTFFLRAWHAQRATGALELET
jgi:hypothetical protein